MLKNKVVIGIIPTFREDQEDPYKNQAYFVKMYEQQLNNCGAIVIGLLDNDLSIYKDIVDAYLWPGGYVIRKDFYIVFEDVIKNNKPLLGVCMGAQAIGTFFNVLDDQLKQPNLSLMEVYDNNKLDNVYLKKLEGDSLNLHSNEVTFDEETINKAKHRINIKKDTYLYDIYKTEEMDVVSLHSFQIARTSKDTIISATSSDGVIEAVEVHKNNLKVLGLQFHPEIINDYKPYLWLVEQAYKKYQILVNKDHEKPSNNPYNIIYYESAYPYFDIKGIEEQTYYAFTKLKEAMKSIGYIIDLESAYRTSEKQQQIYDDTKEEKGEEHAKMYVAPVGHSEHETGLAIDICAYVDNSWKIEFDIPEYIYNKLHEICANYGFILRYPKNKEDVTGYNYEPWHLRYIGDISFAKKLMEEEKVLEEL